MYEERVGGYDVDGGEEDEVVGEDLQPCVGARQQRNLCVVWCDSVSGVCVCVCVLANMYMCYQTTTK